MHFAGKASTRIHKEELRFLFTNLFHSTEASQIEQLHSSPPAPASQETEGGCIVSECFQVQL